MASRPPDAFLSYTRFDDEHDGGAISQFRGRLASAVRAVTGDPFEIFQDVDGIGVGGHWPDKLDRMLDEVRFFIPVLSPSYFKSKACRDELEKFLKAEEDRGHRDLVLPIYYIECDLLEDPDARAADALATILHERQHQDWRELRHDSFEAKNVRQALENLARGIGEARRRQISFDQFRARLPIVEIVGRWVSLTQRGHEYVGLCPFHDDKDPFFVVSKTRGFYHCFGCQQHGNAIDFVMAIENLKFDQAVNSIVKFTGLPAPRGADVRATAVTVRAASRLKPRHCLPRYRYSLVPGDGGR